jgi:hypothetical protein
VVDAQTRVEDLRLRLCRGAAVAGIVRDGSGDPIEGAGVRLLRRQAIGTDAGLQVQAVVWTDDLGAFRAYGLPAGKYIVAVSAPPPAFGTSDVVQAKLVLGYNMRSMRVAYAPVYFPGTANIGEASPIELVLGNERLGVDIAVTLKPVAKVSGTVELPVGLVADSRVTIQPSSVDSLWFAPFSAVSVRSDGHFEFLGIPPGDYIVTAQIRAKDASGERKRTYWAFATVFVTGTDQFVRLIPEDGAAVTGRLTSVGPGNFVDLQASQVRLIPLGERAAALRQFQLTADVSRDGRLEWSGLPLGEYVVRAGRNGSWAPVSATTAGREVLEGILEIRQAGQVNDLEVTYAQQLTQVFGRIHDASKSSRELLVMMIPTEPSFWRLGSRRIPPPVRVAPDGRYALRDLLPGEYCLIVLNDEPEGLDSAVLSEFVRAGVIISVAAGERRAQDLRLGNR